MDFCAIFEHRQLRAEVMVCGHGASADDENDVRRVSIANCCRNDAGEMRLLLAPKL